MSIYSDLEGAVEELCSDVISRQCRVNMSNDTCLFIVT